MHRDNVSSLFYISLWSADYCTRTIILYNYANRPGRINRFYTLNFHAIHNYIKLFLFLALLLAGSKLAVKDVDHSGRSGSFEGLRRRSTPKWRNCSFTWRCFLLCKSSSWPPTSTCVAVRSLPYWLYDNNTIFMTSSTYVRCRIHFRSVSVQIAGKYALRMLSLAVAHLICYGASVWRNIVEFCSTSKQLYICKQELMSNNIDRPMSNIKILLPKHFFVTFVPNGASSNSFLTRSLRRDTQLLYIVRKVFLMRIQRSITKYHTTISNRTRSYTFQL